ncbi:MAG: hypothetical protein ACK5PB_14160 [Pirellula sp.]|jgi:hypothetical protein
MITLATLKLTLTLFACLLTDGATKFEVTTKKSDDQVEIKQLESQTIFIVQSPSGISHANITRITDKWPANISLHLRLHGLESFKLQTEGKTVNLSVSSSSTEVRQWLNEKEDRPLDSKSPFWMEIRLLDRDGKPTKSIPLADGYFEIKLPAKTLESNPRSLKLEWIDFYRN